MQGNTETKGITIMAAETSAKKTAPPVPSKSADAPKQTGGARAAAPATAPAAEKKTRNKLPALDLGAIRGVLQVTNPDTMHRMRPQRTERSPQQQKIDEIVKTAYDAWVAAGSPAKWDSKAPHGMLLSVHVAQYPSLVSAIRKAGRHFNFKLRFGIPVDGVDMEGKPVTEFMFIAMDQADGDTESDGANTPDDDSDDDSDDGE